MPSRTCIWLHTYEVNLVEVNGRMTEHMDMPPSLLANLCLPRKAALLFPIAERCGYSLLWICCGTSLIFAHGADEDEKDPKTDHSGRG
jgi:hypothetical protein